MDDILILAPTRWRLCGAVKLVNERLTPSPRVRGEGRGEGAYPLG